MKFIDAIGHEHVAVSSTDQVPRIVSLVPSLTELLCELGLTNWLVGRTGFCIHPAEIVRKIPKVGGTKAFDIDKIRELAPTHLIVNIDENEKPAVEALAQFIPHVVVTHPLGPRDNPDLFRMLGGIFDADEKARALCVEFEREYAALAAAPRGPSVKVLYCIWKNPWMTVSRDTYIARMLALIGWQQLVFADSARYPQFDWSDPVAQSVDRILLASEPFRFTLAEVATLTRQTGKPVQLVDGEMLSWYGSRAIAGLRYLRQELKAGSC